MDEKRALAGLWSVPGVGPKAIRKVKSRIGLAHVADCLIGEWCEEPELLPTYALERIPRSKTLGELGDFVLAQAARSQMKIAWLGEPAFPERLAQIHDAPPMLFYWGPGNDCPPRRRVAMVGCRHPDSVGLQELEQLAFDTATFGIGIVSGAAQGIDSLAHLHAVRAENGETWAFVGSALDQLDYHQRQLWEALRPKGATYWSELPPGVRADRQTFPRRNRLISGCCEAVVVLRAGIPSGSKFTVEYAHKQGRVILAVPGSLTAFDSEYCNEILTQGAFACRNAEDLMRAIGVTGYVAHIPPPVSEPRAPLTSLSEDAQAVFEKVDRPGKCFDDLIAELGYRSGRLLAALSELVSSSYLLEHSGRRYERVIRGGPDVC